MDKKTLLLLFVTAFTVRHVAAQGELLCANRETVRRLDLVTKEFSTILSGLSRSVVVDFHHQEEIVVWSDVVAEKIYSSPVSSDGPKTLLVDVCVTPDGLAVDWVHDNLYWTDTGKDVIGVARLDGRDITTLLKQDLDEPRAIALDPLEGLMFWTDWGGRAKIERSGMDGDHRRVIVSTGIQWPNGLAIDLSSKTIFWADAKTHVLCASDYNGSNLRTLIDSPTVMRHPFSLDILGDWLYWTEWSSFRESVYKVNKNTGQGVEQVVGGGEWNNLMGIRVYDASKQPKGTNHCLGNGCTHLCLPSWLAFPGARNYTCVCPDALLPGDNCSTVPTTRRLSPFDTTVSPWIESSSSSLLLREIESNSDVILMEWGNSTSEHRFVHEITTKSRVPPGGIIAIVLGLLSIVLIAFFVHKWFSRRAGQASAIKSEGWAGLDNPVYSTTTEDQSSFAKPAFV